LTLKSSSGYTNDLTTPEISNIPPLDLVLPEPLEITANKLIFAIDAYPIILHIYNGYNLWTQTYDYELELNNIINLRLELCFERLALKDETIQVLDDDREHAYQLFNTERDDKDKLAIKNTMKILFVSAGTGLVGVAVGIIVGIIITRN